MIYIHQIGEYQIRARFEPTSEHQAVVSGALYEFEAAFDANWRVGILLDRKVRLAAITFIELGRSLSTAVTEDCDLALENSQPGRM